MKDTALTNGDNTGYSDIVDKELKSATKNRLQWIDLLRGTAAIAVCIHHLFSMFRYFYPTYSVFQKGHILDYDYLSLGRFGVVLFFFISGYVIPVSFQNKTLKQFAISRFFRLYPAYWIAIIAAVALNGIPSLIVLAANITMFQKFGGIPDIVGVFWTLQIELVFYIFCAALFYYKVLFNDKVLKNTFFGLIVLTLIISLGRFETGKKLPVALTLGLAVMFLGFIFRRFIYGEGSFTKNNIITYFVIFWIALLPICVLAYNRDYGFGEQWHQYFIPYSIATGFFLVFSYYKFNSRLMSYMGVISFSMYLFHTIILDALALKYHLASVVSLPIFTLIYFTLIIVTSVLSYHWVEKPMVQVGKKFFKPSSSK